MDEGRTSWHPQDDNRRAGLKAAGRLVEVRRPRRSARRRQFETRKLITNLELRNSYPRRRRFAIHHPFGFAERGQPSREGIRTRQVLQIAEEGEISSLV